MCFVCGVVLLPSVVTRDSIADGGVFVRILQYSQTGGGIVGRFGVVVSVAA